MAGPPPITPWRWLGALRPHQWSKNALLLLPAVAAHVVWTPAVVSQLAGALGAFSLLASATYLLNDIVDITHDRQHPTKRHRAVAAGHMSTRAAFVIAAVLIVAAAALARPLPVPFQVTLAAYLVLTALYSLVLKRQAVVDVWAC